MQLEKRTVSYLSKVLATMMVLAATFMVADAQPRDNSAYSRYGWGDVVPGYNIINRSMGGTYSATKDVQNINFNNPATYSAIRLTTFNIGLEWQNRNISEESSNEKFTGNYFNVPYVMLGLPLKKNWGMVLGLRPVTRISYKIGSREPVIDENTGQTLDSAVNIFQGNGGSYQLFTGTGYQYKGLSVGANFGYFWGNKNLTTTRSMFSDSLNIEYQRARYARNYSFGTWFASAGLQYEVKWGKKKDGFLIVGANANLKREVTAKLDYAVNTFDESPNIGETIGDSIFVQNNLEGSLTYPDAYSVGVNVGQLDKWSAAIDYRTARWSQYELFGQKDPLIDSWSMHFGGSFTPDINSPTSYFSRITYRAGYFFGKDYVKVDNEMPTWGVSLGLSLPMRKYTYTNQYTSINTFFEFGQRGNNLNLVRENFVRLGVGFALSDIWFQKRKYD